MSFLYKHFGIPRSLDEFLDKLGKTNETSVDIYIVGGFRLNLGGMLPDFKHPLKYINEWGLRTKKDKLRLGHREILLPAKEDLSKMVSAGENYLHYLRTALDYSEMINYWGYGVTINHEPVERMKQRINFQETRLEAFKDNLASQYLYK